MKRSSARFLVPALPLLLVIASLPEAPAAEPSPQLRDTLEGHVSIVESLAFSPHGKTLASGGGYTDGTIRLWDVADALERSVIRCGKERVAALAFSSDGKVLASGGSDTAIRLWDPETGKLERALPPLKGGVNDLAFSADGRWLASACDADDAVRLWNAKDWSIACDCTIRWGAHSVAFSADSAVLLGGGRFGRLYWWRVPSGGTLKYRSLGEGKVTVAVSGDGALLACGSKSKLLQIWDMAKRTRLRYLKPVCPECPFAFAPDASVLAVGGKEPVVTLWDAKTGQQAGTLVGHTGGVWALAFSPDGKLLATGSDDRTVRIWTLAGKPGQ